MAATPEGLSCPESYLLASEAERREVCNGCGFAGAKFDFIPDTIWGMPICPACDIHDWQYHEGNTNEDKAVADRTFMNNLLRLIEQQDAWIGRLLKPLRRRRTLKYYEAVVVFGGPAFWRGRL